MNRKSFLLISLLTTMFLVVACGGAQPDTGNAEVDDPFINRTAAVSQQEIFASEPTATVIATQSTEMIESERSGQSNSPGRILFPLTP